MMSSSSFSFNSQRSDQCGTVDSMPRQRLVTELPGMNALQARAEAPRLITKVLEGWRRIEVLKTRRGSIFGEGEVLARWFIEPSLIVELSI